MFLEGNNNSVYFSHQFDQLNSMFLKKIVCFQIHFVLCLMANGPAPVPFFIELLISTKTSTKLCLPENSYHSLKPMDPFGKQYCPRQTLRVSQLIFKKTNL